MEIYSFFRGLLGKQQPPGSSRKSFGDWVSVGAADGGVNERKLLDANEEWVAIAVDKIASSTASVRFKVMKYSSTTDDQEVFDGPLVKFLEQPAEGFTGKDFIYASTIYKELTGNAFWMKASKRQVMPLQVLIPTSVTPILTGSRLTGYKYSTGTSQRDLSLEEVLHDRYIDPAKPYWGKGKLTKIARWVDISSFSNEFLRRFFIQGATFGGFIETEEESEERIKLIRAGLVNSHTGVANSHKLGILPKGAKYAKTTANMAEIEMGATDDRYRDKILAAFGVPKNLLGLTQGENRATVEGTEYGYLKHTIKPIADDLVEFLNVHVAPLLDPSGKTYFAYEDFIPRNMEHELREREIALNRQPYMTVNEVRAEKGLPAVPGGDVVYGSPLMVPLGTPPEALEEPEDDEDDEDTPPPQKARQKAIPAHVRAAVRREGSLSAIVDSISTAATKIAATYTDRETLDADAHKAFVGRVTPYTERIEKSVRDFNNRQERQVLLDMASITKAVAKSDLWDVREEVQVMVDIVTPLLSGLVYEQVLAEWEAQGFGPNIPSGSELVRNVVERAARRLAKSYNNTTANLLKKTLNEGILAGDSMDQLKRRVQEVYAFSNEVRAKMVAQTESFYIANKANQIAYKASGVVKTMRWYTAEDERVCPFCGPQHGRVIGVTETFFKKGDSLTAIDETGKLSTINLKYRTIDVPPLHTNCRCFVRPEEISIED